MGNLRVHVPKGCTRWDICNLAVGDGSLKMERMLRFQPRYAPSVERSRRLPSLSMIKESTLIIARHADWYITKAGNARR